MDPCLQSHVVAHNWLDSLINMAKCETEISLPFNFCPDWSQRDGTAAQIPTLSDTTELGHGTKWFFFLAYKCCRMDVNYWIGQTQGWLEWRRVTADGCCARWTFPSLSPKSLYVFIHSPASFLRHVPTSISMICCAHCPKWLGFSNFTGHWHTYVSDALIKMQKAAAASDCRCSLDQTRATGINIFLQTDDTFRQHIYSWLHFLLNKWVSFSATQGVVAAACRQKSQLCVALIKQIWMHMIFGSIIPSSVICHNYALSGVTWFDTDDSDALAPLAASEQKRDELWMSSVSALHKTFISWLQIRETLLD